MEKKKLLNKALGIATSVALVAGMPLVAFADGGTNISSQEIPVTATIDSYYVVDVPAGLDGSGNLNLTRENNAYITDEVATSTDPFYNKKEATFYGYTSVGMHGVIANNQKVHVGLTCADLEKSGDTTTTAPVRLENLPITTTAEKTLVQNVQALWAAANATDKEAAKVTLPETWAVGSTGIAMDFTSTTQSITGNTIGESADTGRVEQFAMLKTVLPVNGTYNGNLVVTFSLTNA